MPKTPFAVELLVLCDQAIISKENKLSIIGIFDQMFLSSVTTHYPKMTIVGVLSGEPNTSHKIKLDILNPQQETIFSGSAEVQLGSNGRSNLITELTSFPVALAGDYKIFLYQDKNTLGSRPFTVFKEKDSKNVSKVVN